MTGTIPKWIRTIRRNETRLSRARYLAPQLEFSSVDARADMIHGSTFREWVDIPGEFLFMLRVLGSYRQSHGSMSRRDLLQAGSLGAIGLALPDLFRMQHAAQAAEQNAALARSFGRAKSCILLYLYGAASQLETFDVKPDAPREIRGDLGATSTAIPGVQIGELLPRMARMLDRTTIVRSMTHPFPLHAVAYSVTSNPQIDVPMQMNPRDPRHWPFIGSVVDYMAQHDPHAPAAKIPRNVCLPWRLSSRRQYAAGDNAGPFGAFLGAAYDPVCTDFHGEGSRKSTYTFGPDTITCFDPYGPLKSGYRFDLSAAQLPDEITLDRLNRRRSLLAQFDEAPLGGVTTARKASTAIRSWPCRC